MAASCKHTATRIERGASKNPVRIDYVREVCLACGESKLRRVENLKAGGEQG